MAQVPRIQSDALGQPMQSFQGDVTLATPTAGAICDGSGPASQGNTGAGNPINLTHGNKYQMEVNLPALAGELGL